MRYFTTSVAILIFWGLSGVCLGQEPPDYESILASLAYRGATVSCLESPATLRPAKAGDLEAGILFINLFDCMYLDLSIKQLQEFDGQKHILIGNRLANLHVRNFADSLSHCKNVKVVILDSVDSEPEILSKIQKTMVGTRFILSERTAIKCVNDSYRFGLGGRGVGTFGRQRMKNVDSIHFDQELFAVAHRFVGRELIEGGWRKPLNREAVSFFRHMRNLTGICFSGIPVVDHDLSYLGKATKVTYLNLDESLIKGYGLESVAFKNMKTLVVTNIPTLETIPFDNFPALEVLLVSQSGISIESLKDVSKCDKLVELEMAGIKCNTLDLKQILKGNPTLVDLTLCAQDIRQDKGEPTLEDLQIQFPAVRIAKAPSGFSRQEHGWWSKQAQDKN